MAVEIRHSLESFAGESGSIWSSARRLLSGKEEEVFPLLEAAAMKAIYVNRYGGLDALEYGDLPDPVAGVEEKMGSQAGLDAWIEGFRPRALEAGIDLGAEPLGHLDPDVAVAGRHVPFTVCPAAAARGHTR